MSAEETKWFWRVVQGGGVGSARWLLQKNTGYADDLEYLEVPQHVQTLRLLVEHCRRRLSQAAMTDWSQWMLQRAVERGRLDVVMFLDDENIANTEELGRLGGFYTPQCTAGACPF